MGLRSQALNMLRDLCMFAGGASVCFALCLPRVENAKRRLSRVVIRDKPSRSCALLPRTAAIGLVVAVQK